MSGVRYVRTSPYVVMGFQVAADDPVEVVEELLGSLVGEVLDRAETRDDPAAWVERARQVVAGAAAAHRAGWHPAAAALLAAVEAHADNDALRAAVDNDDEVRGALEDGGLW